MTQRRNEGEGRGEKENRFKQKRNQRQNESRAFINAEGKKGWVVGRQGDQNKGLIYD